MSYKHIKTIKPILAWIAGNFLGIAVPSSLVFFIPNLETIDSIAGIVGIFLIIFIPIGLAQWLVLRRFTPLSPLWMLTIPVGFVLSFFILAFIPNSMWQNIDDEAPTVLTILFTACGAVFGLVQWVLLRRLFAKSSFWILSSALGLGLGFGLVLATDMIDHSGFISGIIVILLYSIATGSTLSWLLNYHNRSHTPSAGNT
jgi:hypothetical protein